MSLPQYAVILIFILTIVGLVVVQKNPATILGCTILCCYGFNLVSTETLLNSFANQGLIIMILIVICSFAIEKTMFIRNTMNFLLKGETNASTFKIFAVPTILSGFLNNTAIVATLMGPISQNKFINPSKLLLPLSYLAIAGGTLTLVGTSTNLIVNSLMIDAGFPELHFFTFTYVGIFTTCSVFITVWICKRWLPDHKIEKTKADSYFIEAKVLPESTLIGKSIDDNSLRNLESLFLVEIIRNGRAHVAVNPQETILAGDRLLFAGDITKVTVLHQINGLEIFASQEGFVLENLTEVLIKSSAEIIGMSLKGMRFRAKFDAAVVGIKREGVKLSGKLGSIILREGDFLILATGMDFPHKRNLTKNFHMISGVTTDDILTKGREKIAIIGFFTAIGISLLGVSLLKAFIVYLAVLIITKCLDVNEIKMRFPIEIWLVVAGALTLTKAFTASGLAILVSSYIGEVFSNTNFFVAFIGVYLFTMIMTEIITNNAAAALSFPIALSVAAGVGANPMPFIMAVAFGASASFLSPYGYQTNLMIYNAGGYKLKDFLKIGIPVSIAYGVTAIICIPIFFPF